MWPFHVIKFTFLIEARFGSTCFWCLEVPWSHFGDTFSSLKNHFFKRAQFHGDKSTFLIESSFLTTCVLRGQKSSNLILGLHWLQKNHFLKCVPLHVVKFTFLIESSFRSTWLLSANRGYNMPTPFRKMHASLPHGHGGPQRQKRSTDKLQGFFGWNGFLGP